LTKKLSIRTNHTDADASFVPLIRMQRDWIPELTKKWSIRTNHADADASFVHYTSHDLY
jgi:hypothetical protein